MNYFIASKKQPYHLSVGAVVFNDKGQICAHYLKDVTVQGRRYEDFYLLMKETLHPGESLEEGAHRGLMEEFGMNADLKDFIGSYQTVIPREDFMFDKTTLYFTAAHETHDESKRSQEDIEGGSVIVWNTPEFFIEKMKEQGKRIGPPADESQIVERAVKVYKK